MPALQGECRVAQRYPGRVIPGNDKPVIVGVLSLMRRVSIICFAITACLAALTVSACASSATEDPDTAVSATISMTDFATLQPPDKPNNWLVAPADFSGIAAVDETAPVFDVSASVLAEAWRIIIEAEPRTTILAISDDDLRIEAEQKSAVFGFVDRVSVQVVPLDDGRSTFMAYSTSLVGYWDMGANRSRLQDWIAALQNTVKAVSAPR